MTASREDILRLVNRLQPLNRGREWNPGQAAVIRAVFKEGKKRIFIRCGRKAGKTECVSYISGRVAGLKNRAACYYLLPTLKLAKEVLWANGRVQGMIPAEWRPRFKETETRVVLDTGSFIKFEGADNYAQLAGIEGDLFIFDELKDHDPRAYHNCYPNIAARDAIWIVVGSPPDNKNNFYYKLEQEIRKDPDWAFFHWPTWDNARFLPGGMEWLTKEKARYIARGDADLWEIDFEGRYNIGGRRSLLPGFSRDHSLVGLDVALAHIARAPQDKLEFYRIFDPSYADCFAVIWAVYDPYSHSLWILDEMYEKNRSKLATPLLWPEIVAKSLRLFPKVFWRDIYDSAAPGFPQEVRAQFGEDISFRPCEKGKGDDEKYYRVLNSGFLLRTIRVAESCFNTILEIEGCVTNDKNQMPDTDNHILDCLRYLVKTCGFERRQKQDDVILRRDGFTDPERSIIRLPSDNPGLNSSARQTSRDFSQLERALSGNFGHITDMDYDETEDF